jgi:hypothetical protein
MPQCLVRFIGQNVSSSQWNVNSKGWNLCSIGRNREPVGTKPIFILRSHSQAANSDDWLKTQNISGWQKK